MGGAGNEDRPLPNDERQLSDAVGTGSLNRLWGQLIVHELAVCGCIDVWLSPGARSAPLAVAAIRHRDIRVVSCVDERAAAFQAVGLARATGRPAAVVCTSGTAAANYLPAVVEARQSGLPLIVLTADRPPELRDADANQAIDQPGLFGSHVLWRCDLPCPDPRLEAAFVQTTVDQAVHRARAGAGPVHLNCMFAEPLLDDGAAVGPIEKVATQPRTHYRASSRHPDAAAIRDATAVLAAATTGVIAVGPLPAATDRTPIRQLAARLGWPLLADIQSGLRFPWAGRSDTHVVDHHGLVLTALGEAALPEETAILHFGGRLTSKGFLTAIASRHGGVYMHAAVHPRRQDPLHRVTERIQADPGLTAEALNEALPETTKPDGRDRLRVAGEAVAATIARILDAKDSVNEPGAAAALIELLPRDWGVFAGGSMPIRDLDTFARVATMRDTPLVVGANRGASGIDGSIASSVGFAIGRQSPVSALVGDVAALHDLGSFNAVATSPHPVVVVVVNNHGGGIFSFLPFSEPTEVFELAFGTPHRHRFHDVGRMFGLDYYRPESSASLRDVLAATFRAHRSAVIEVETDRSANLTLQEQIRDASRDAVRGAVQ